MTRQPKGRLSLLEAAFVMARRDFMAILFSRAFLFFLLGPLFPLLVGALAGGIGSQVRDSVQPPSLGVAMSAAETERITATYTRLSDEMGVRLPVLRVLDEGQDTDAALADDGNNLGAILTGSLDAPRLVGTQERIDRWRGDSALLVDAARRGNDASGVSLTLQPITDLSGSDRNQARLLTAQGAQVLLFLLSMLLAGMVLSNLVEEKANKIIEVLSAAIPMDAVFLGKLFAMLAVSLVGMVVWGSVGGIATYVFADPVALPDPAVGWPAFIALFVVYFSMNYLLVGSLFLAIGALATTVREVQTISMPVTMSQVLIFFLAGLAIAQPGDTIGWIAAIFPLSSPYTMLAWAALEEGWAMHLAAIAWQALFVALFIRFGAQLFRRRVLNSGSKRTRSDKATRWWNGLRA